MGDSGRVGLIAVVAAVMSVVSGVLVLVRPVSAHVAKPVGAIIVVVEAIVVTSVVLRLARLVAMATIPPHFIVTFLRALLKAGAVAAASPARTLTDVGQVVSVSRA